MTEEIKKLRSLFKKFGIDAYLVTSTDEFQNEYVPNHSRRLEYLTNFTGSFGIAIVTEKDAALLTDGRYLLQAKKELDPVFKIFDIHKNKYISWCKKYLGKNQKLGYDPMLYTEKTLQPFKRLAEKELFTLEMVDENLVDIIWKDKPDIDIKKAFLLAEEYTGLSTKEKIQEVLLLLNPQADYLFITNLDSICWLLNIRGSDIEYSPLLLSYLLLHKNGEITLSCNIQQVKHLNLGVNILEIEAFKNHFKQLLKHNIKIQLDPSNTPIWFLQSTVNNIIKQQNPIERLKARKNKVELQGFYDCHIEDGIAVTKLLAWLFNNRRQIDELEAIEKLNYFRKKSKLFQFNSFSTISAYGKNASVIHYSPTKQSNSVISSDNLYLLDSGGHYLNGTTDVTRTVFLGVTPTKEYKKFFTLVLKGHIAIANVIFPKGTTGAQLDTLARYHLWQYGKDYQHSTGHGVGHFLSVHEGPCRIGYNNSSSEPLEEGMILSNEPGFYKEDNFGIRIENLMVVNASKFSGFLKFDILTLVPIQTSLIDFGLLNNDEVKWVYNYNKRVLKTLSQYLSEEEKDFIASH